VRPLTAADLHLKKTRQSLQTNLYLQRERPASFFTRSISGSGTPISNGNEMPYAVSELSDEPAEPDGLFSKNLISDGYLLMSPAPRFPHQRATPVDASPLGRTGRTAA
jgi:hypothetical protein